MAKKYGYVVMRTQYSYNDERFYQDGDESGSPVKIFSDKKAAEASAKQLTKEFWKENDPIGYGEELTELFDEKVLEPFAASGKLNDPSDWYDLTDDEKALLIEGCSINAFYVQKVECE